MEDPVSTPNGDTYDRSAIQKEIFRSGMCPVTRYPLSTTDLRPNRVVQGMIGDWKEHGKNKPDYGQIVLDLQQLKQERKMQEQKIEAGHNNLPDVGTLTESASHTQRAADGA
jgi:hypothetical protein